MIDVLNQAAMGMIGLTVGVVILHVAHQVVRKI